MSEILFISHRIPFPPDRGDKIRSHHIVKRLARLAPVHIATFADDELDMAEEVELATLARSYKLVRRAKPLVLAGVQALAARLPVSLTAFYDAGLAAYIDDIVANAPNFNDLCVLRADGPIYTRELRRQGDCRLCRCRFGQIRRLCRQTASGAALGRIARGTDAAR